MLSAAEEPAARVESGSSAAEVYLESLGQFGIRLGLDRIETLLASLGHPERRFPAIHVVGTNGKSTTSRMIEALIAAHGISVGTYLSPHLTRWSERIRINGEEIDLEEPVQRVREAVRNHEVTQFEVLTAAAFVSFADRSVDLAVVEAGLGGRYDATNVLDAKVVVLTNVSLDHTQHLGATRPEIAAEKLAAVGVGCTVVLGDGEWESAARLSGAEKVRVSTDGSNAACAAEAATAFLGHPVNREVAMRVSLPGRLEVMGTNPTEIWDGAHNPAAVQFLLRHLPPGDMTLVLSILKDKDVDAMLRLFSERASRVVATSSFSRRALPAGDLAESAARHFSTVLAVENPTEAIERAREAAGPNGTVVVSGSLALLEALATVRCSRLP